MDIRLKIKEIRKQKKISQEAIAKYLGMKQSSYSDIEHLKTRLSLDDFAKICKILNVEPISLMIGSDEIIIKITKDQADAITDLSEQIQSQYNMSNIHDFTVNGDFVFGNKNQK